MVSTTLWFIPNIPRDCKITEKTNLLFLPGGRTRIKVSHHHRRGPRSLWKTAAECWIGVTGEGNAKRAVSHPHVWTDVTEAGGKM